MAWTDLLPQLPHRRDGLYPPGRPAGADHAGFDPRNGRVSYLSDSLARRAWLVYSPHLQSSVFGPGSDLPGPSSAFSLLQPSLSS